MKDPSDVGPFFLTLLAFASLPFTISLGGLFLLLALVAQAWKEYSYLSPPPTSPTGGEEREGVPQGKWDPGPSSKSSTNGRAPSRRPDLIYRLMILFCLLTLVQTLWVPDPWSHLAGLTQHYVAPFLMVWLVVRQRWNRAQQDLVLLVAVGAVTLQAGFGIFHYFTGEHHWRFLPLAVANETVYLLDLGLITFAPGRAHGILMYPTALSTLIISALPLACGLWERSPSARVRLLLTAALLVSLVALALTFTRMAWLVLVPTLLAFAWFSRRWKAVTVSLLGFSLTLALVVTLRPAVGEQLGTRAQIITSVQEPSNAQRLSIWRTYLQVTRDYFWQGTGILNDGKIFPLYRPPDFPGVLVNPNAHSWYLQVAHESGVPLVLLFFTILGIPIVRAWNRRDLCGTDRIDRAALSCSLLGFCLVAVTAFHAGELRVSLLFWLSLALLIPLTPSCRCACPGR